MLCCLADGKAHIFLTVNAQKICTDTIRIGVKQLLCRRIDADNPPFCVQQNKGFFHIFCDLVEFILFLFQRPHLFFNLLPLGVDAVQQGRKLLIGIIVHRFIQIQLIQWVNNTLCHAVGKPCRQSNGCQSDCCQRLNHAQNQYQCGSAADRDAKYSSIAQAGCFINGLFRQSRGITSAATGAGNKGFLDFFTGSVVFHCGCICVTVKDNRTISTYPSQAVSVRVQIFQIAFSELLGCFCG